MVISKTAFRHATARHVRQPQAFESISQLYVIALNASKPTKACVRMLSSSACPPSALQDQIRRQRQLRSSPSVPLAKLQTKECIRSDVCLPAEVASHGVEMQQQIIKTMINLITQLMLVLRGSLCLTIIMDISCIFRTTQTVKHNLLRFGRLHLKLSAWTVWLSKVKVSLEKYGQALPVRNGTVSLCG